MGGNDTIYGNGGDDIINGGAGNDTMYGGSGNDQFQYGSIDPGGLNTGFDYVDGGDGYDILITSSTPTYLWTAVGLTHLSGVEMLFNTSTTQPGYILVNGDVNFSEVQREVNITSITGQSGNDTITGSSNMYGGVYLAENILGGAGDDILDGGAGANSLTGNAGIDTFKVTQDHDYSTIYDFTDGVDKIQLPVSYTDLNIADDGLGYAHITSAIHDVDITVVGVDTATLNGSPTDLVYA
jgi:Ca2+-binding RTX toxin-like protein